MKIGHSIDPSKGTEKIRKIEEVVNEPSQLVLSIHQGGPAYLFSDFSDNKLFFFFQNDDEFARFNRLFFFD